MKQDWKASLSDFKARAWILWIEWIERMWKYSTEYYIIKMTIRDNQKDLIFGQMDISTQR